MAEDAHYASVSLLLPFKGANNATSTTDYSPTPKTVSFFGNAKISTAQSKFEGSSLLLDGVGDYLTVPSNAAFTFGTGNFSIDCWVRITAYTNASNWIIGNYVGAAGGYFAFYIDSSGANLGFRNADTNVVTQALSSAIPTGVWKHLQVCRSGNTLYFFLDGVLQGSGSAFSANLSSQGVCGIGSQAPSYPNDGELNGHIADLRVTKGVARNTTSFTPPSVPNAKGLGEVQGVVRDDAGAPCARTVRLYRRDTGALVASEVSDATTGLYRIGAPTLDEVSRIVLDDSGGSLYNDLIDRVIPA